mgnify:CR=1 FL=1
MSEYLDAIILLPWAVMFFVIWRIMKPITNK